MRRVVLSLLSCLLLSGCFGPGDGVEVPQDQIYFPVGLALDQDAAHLFVVSSDFDLQYNGGAVQAFDLDALASKLPTRCRSDADCETGACQPSGLCPVPGSSPASLCPQGERSDSDRLLYPGLCQPLSLDPYDTVKIGAFATDGVLRQRPSTAPSGAAARLFVPVRGDSTLHWIDIDHSGLLACGQERNSGACDSVHRAGNDPTQNTRGITLNTEPFAIDADAQGDAIVLTNQTTGTLALFDNRDWDEHGPSLQFELASSRIPSRPVGIASVPRPRQTEAAGPDGEAFLITFRNSAQVRLARYASDEPSSPARQYLIDGGGVSIDANSVGSDSRGIAVDPSARQRAEAQCAADDADCLAQAALVPLDVYLANRSPQSLLVGRTRPPQEYPYFFRSVPLTSGPSRVVVGQVRSASGELETRVFVVCFDSRRIIVYDPQRSRIEKEILTGRGPYALAVDTQRALLYVAQFTDSYIGVYSLDLGFPATYGTVLGTLGTPRAPRSAK